MGLRGKKGNREIRRKIFKMVVRSIEEDARVLGEK